MPSCILPNLTNMQRYVHISVEFVEIVNKFPLFTFYQIVGGIKSYNDFFHKNLNQMCVYSKMFIYHHHYPIKHRTKKSLIMNITQKILVINVGPAAQKFCCVDSLCNVMSRFEHFVFCILFVED